MRSLFFVLGAIPSEALTDLESEYLITEYKNKFGIENRSGWKDEFKMWADIVMNLGSPYCGTLQECADSMYTYFKDFLMEDQTNNYLSLVFCADEDGHRPDRDGNVWWYDHYQADTDLPYWIVDVIQRPGQATNDQDPCQGKGMYIRGVEVDISISLQASPDWRHTKWDLTHEGPNDKGFKGDPLFDYTPHPGCCSPREGRCCQGASSDGNECDCSDGKCNWGDVIVDDYTDKCKMPNPCGKADVLQNMWRQDINDQLYGKDTHILMTICQKDGQWQDADPSCGTDPESQKCKIPGFKSLGNDQMGFRLFEPSQFSNSIWDHIEWDKAPRETVNGHVLGEGDGWEPFKFSQCCTTIGIAPQI